MHKCPECGAEYEGNFCPNFGEQWQDEKTCPNCGTKLNGSAKFCNECGYSFINTNHTDATPKKVAPVEPTVVPKPNEPESYSSKEDYKKAREEYKEYCRASIKYKYAKRDYERTDGKTTPAAVVWLDINKKRIALIATAVITVICAILITTLAIIDALNIFKIAKVSEVHLGYTQKQVRSILGDPYKEESTEDTWVYYEDSYTDLLKKIAANDEAQLKAFDAGDEKKLLKLMEEEAKLDEQLENLVYKFIQITYSTSTGENGETIYAVNGVLFDSARCDAINYENHKKIKGLPTIINRIYYFSEPSKIEYTAEYQDGSYYCGYATATLAEGETTRDTSKTSVKLNWNDYYGEKITSLVELKYNSDGYYFNNSELIVESNHFDLSENEKNEIKSVMISNGVTFIGDSAFRSCSSLTSITIPDNVTSIGIYAFEGCSSLTTVNWNATACTNAGQPTYSIYPIYSIFSKCTNLTTVTIGDNVEIIPCYAFYECSKLTSVTIPDSVTSIGKYAFYYCRSLTSVTIPDSVTSIGDSAFRSCSSLTSVTIPDSVTSIGSSAFEGCSSLTSVTIPDSVTSIGSSAFEGCSSLTSVTIPDSVTSIGDSAFRSCSSLTSVTIPDSVTSIGSSAFDNTAYYYNSNNWVNNVLYIGKHLIEAKSSISGTYTIKDGTLTIADYAFYNCSSLTSVTIPDSVTSIGFSAFDGCSSLTSVTFKNTNGWWCLDTYRSTCILSIYLSNTSTAATCLTSTYCYHYWKRS